MNLPFSRLRFERCSLPLVSRRLLLSFLYLLIALSIAAVVPPQLLIAGSVLVFAVSTSFTAPLLQSSAAVYVADVMVLLIAFRGVLPRDRIPSNWTLAGWPTVLFSLWAVTMVVAAVRGMGAGVELASVVRGELSLIYWPLLYFGYARILRERAFRVSQLWRELAYVAVGLATWMFVARVLNQPFEDTGLGRVPTGDGQVVKRNFGFAGAFVVYPVLALAGIRYGSRRRTPEVVGTSRRHRHDRDADHASPGWHPRSRFGNPGRSLAPRAPRRG